MLGYWPKSALRFRRVSHFARQPARRQGLAGSSFLFSARNLAELMKRLGKQAFGYGIALLTSKLKEVQAAYQVRNECKSMHVVRLCEVSNCANASKAPLWLGLATWLQHLQRYAFSALAWLAREHKAPWLD